jgi:N-acetylmuramic acid 6-phosphate etherase
VSRALVVRLVEAEAASQRAARRATRAIAAVVDLAVTALRGGGRLFYLGAGTSGRLGALDAAECPPTFGTPPRLVQAIVAGGVRALRRSVEGAEDRPSEAIRELRRRKLSRADLVVGITASGTTPFVLGGLAAARKQRVPTALVTCGDPDPGSADVIVRLAVGPEVLRGSTRLKAGTATKIALNAISTATMIALGHAHGDAMIDVVASNAKLRARARGLLAEIGGVAERDLDRLLDAAGGRVKVAVVMARLGLSRRAAVRRLAEVGGRLDALVPR